MSPSLKTQSEINGSKSGSSSKLKRLFSKLVFKEKVKIKADTNDEHYHNTTDAIPDLPRSEDNQKPFVENVNQNIENKSANVSDNTRNASQNDDSKDDLKEDWSEKESSGIGTGHKTYPSPNSKQRPQYILNQTSLVVNNGVGLHFGNNFTNVNNVYYGQSPHKKEGFNKVEKTDVIRGLLKCKDKIEAGHLQLLSSHFGKSWEEIGLSLGFTKGELQIIKDEKKELQEQGFLVLKRWWQKTGESATVGDLCKKLWKVEAAREAIHQLSINFDLLK